MISNDLIIYYLIGRPWIIIEKVCVMIVEKVVCHISSLRLDVLKIENIEASVVLCTLFDFFLRELLLLLLVLLKRSGS